VVAGQVHNSPLKVVGIEDADGVVGGRPRGVGEERGHAEQGVGVVLLSVDGSGGEVVAEDLAGLCEAGARDPKDGVVGDGEDEELVEEVASEVAALHVGELVGEGGGEVFLRERLGPAGGEQDCSAEDANGDRAGDVWVCGEVGVGYGEALGASLPGLCGGGGERDGLGVASEELGLAEAPCEAGGEEEHHGEVREGERVE